MTVLKTMITNHPVQTTFDNYRSFSDYVAARASRLPRSLVEALTMDYGRIWKAYYRKVKSSPSHVLIVIGSREAEHHGINAVVLKWKLPNGRDRLSLLYGWDYLVRYTPVANKFKLQQWRSGLADRKNEKMLAKMKEEGIVDIPSELEEDAG